MRRVLATQLWSVGARKCASTGSGSAGPLVIGDTRKGIRDGSAFHITRSDIMGPVTEERIPIEAGELMAFLDTSAGDAAWFYFSGVRRDGKKFTEGMTIATVAFNSVTFEQPIYSGDLVHIDGRVVHVGRSSMGVGLSVYRQNWDVPTMSRVCDCFATLVTIDQKELKTCSGQIHALRLDDPVDVLLHERYMSIREIQAASSLDEGKLQGETLNAKDVEIDINKAKPRKVRISDTRTFGTREYGAKFLNRNGAIFGGELLLWLSRHAGHCGRVFARTPHIHMVSMHDTTFEQPVFASDYSTLEAKVVYVHNSTMVIDVKMHVERGSERLVSHRGSFVYVCLDKNGKPKSIDCGLDLTDETQDNLRTYLKHHYRYEASLEKRKYFPPLPEVKPLRGR